MKLRILDICKQAGMTQKELAERIGLSPVGLSKAINGNPTKDTLERIASALNVRITELFEEPTNINGYIELDGTIHKVSSKDDIKKLAEKL
ncbi:helix-turn-helix domain-containing protein [Parabacteroides distasonis]|jgi:transcriptional regulator with XRE-family HTH domain|uniref:Helix-turn-helix transcriptional regulator n=1 Tax=Parabacteroides distasonis TaxID=823 RepID=A0A5C6KNR3_PARDI|nr:helix-turn-helix transcriptional regulator [Parabacteroides distasonis]TWV64054.1 helix-turn-helix transcriptional regulator [Parabacteroides distasonis]